MYKIFMTVRNRLEITKKAIEALYNHSTSKFQLYVYNNSTNYRIIDQFDYFRKLYENNLVSQICFTTNDSSFHAFSKASTCNFFGLQHEQDPKKNTYDFLLFLDNDIIVTPKFDEKIFLAWRDIIKYKMNYIHIVAQLPGGVKETKVSPHQIAKMESYIGRLGGSGLWSARPTFFRDIGYLDLNILVNQDKKHDQSYWRLMDQKNNGKEYILGLQTRLGIHTGKICGSVCNVLTKNRKVKDKLDLIKFEDQEKFIHRMSFEQFYNYIKDNQDLLKDW